MAISSAFVAILAVALSAYTVHLQRQQLRAQVWPHVAILTGNVDGVYVRLMNQGVGPALVRSAELRVDGKPMKDWNQVVKALGPHEKTKLGSLHGVLAVGLTNFAIEFADTTDETPIARIRIDLCYCSVLGECWQTGSDEPLPSGCPKTENEFDE